MKDGYAGGSQCLVDVRFAGEMSVRQSRPRHEHAIDIAINRATTGDLVHHQQVPRMRSAAVKALGLRHHVKPVEAGRRADQQHAPPIDPQVIEHVPKEVHRLEAAKRR